MKLNKWTNEQRGRSLQLARDIGVSAPIVSDWCTGKKGVPVERCVAIERATEGAVTRQDLRPDDWQDIWPELAEARSEAQPERVKDAINGVTEEAQAVILQVAEDAAAEIRRAIQARLLGAAPWDGAERRHLSAAAAAAVQEIAGPPAPVDPALALAMAEAAKAGLIERRRILRRAQDKARAALAARAGEAF